MQTTLTAYKFDVREPEQAAAYEALCQELKSQGLKCFETWGGGSHYCPDLAGSIQLDLKHIFNNQWNTKDTATDNGHRVHDWAQDYNVGGYNKLKRGHYLKQTPNMRDIRRNTNACGYCGHQEPAAKGATFCPKCIGSEYLAETELRLTRMRAVDETGDRAELTEAERGHLMPVYQQAQIHGHTERDRKRITKKRAQVIAGCEKTTADAVAERDGFLWLMDHGINLNLVIYYKHTTAFNFGWRQAIGPEALETLTAALDGFPYPYTIQTVEGSNIESPTIS